MLWQCLQNTLPLLPLHQELPLQVDYFSSWIRRTTSKLNNYHYNLYGRPSSHAGRPCHSVCSCTILLSFRRPIVNKCLTVTRMYKIGSEIGGLTPQFGVTDINQHFCACDLRSSSPHDRQYLLKAARNFKKALQTMITIKEAHLIAWTFVHKRRTIEPEFRPTKNAFLHSFCHLISDIDWPDRHHVMFSDDQYLLLGRGLY